MAKALYSVQTGPDPRMVAEVARLRARVQDLEVEVAALRSADSAADVDLTLLSQDAAVLV